MTSDHNDRPFQQALWRIYHRRTPACPGATAPTCPGTIPPSASACCASIWIRATARPAASGRSCCARSIGCGSASTCGPARGCWTSPAGRAVRGRVCPPRRGRDRHRLQPRQRPLRQGAGGADRAWPSAAASSRPTCAARCRATRARATTRPLFIYGQLARLHPRRGGRAAGGRGRRPCGRPAGWRWSCWTSQRIDKSRQHLVVQRRHGLWGDAPFLNLGERFWDAEQRASIDRFFVDPPAKRRHGGDRPVRQRLRERRTAGAAARPAASRTPGPIPPGTASTCTTPAEWVAYVAARR